MLKTIISLITITALYSVANAHNENIPGPHGGRTQMPANFHTEVVADKDGSFHIYLLDMEFKNPTVQNSEVKASVTTGTKSKIKLKCSVMNGDHFHCKGTKPVKTGNLILKVKRNGTSASMDAQYELPLKPFDATVNQAPAPMEDHSAHH